MKWWIVVLLIYAVIRSGMYLYKWYHKKNKDSFKD